MLQLDSTVLVVIDVQDRLFRVMPDREALAASLRKLIKGALVLGVPVIFTEQNPRGLGPTIAELASLVPGIQPIPKLSFSGCGDERFRRELEALGRRQVLLAGIELHICVYQTALDLLASGYEVQVVADCVASRRAEDKEIGLAKLRDSGAGLATAEMALFELLKTAEGDVFKEISRIVK
jgi:nicotinamidase-related amidase